MIKIAMSIWLLSTALFALEWSKDLDSALAIAKNEHKNVMVMVESSHCGWCKKMKKNTLSDEKIEKRLKQYVVVKVMRGDVQAMSKLPAVNGVPTIFFMKPNKQVLEEVVGYFDASDFNTYIDDVEKKVR